MAQFASATFTASDGTELNAADSNFTRYSYNTVNSQIGANRVRPSANSGTTCYYHSGTPANADYEVSAEIYYNSAIKHAHGVVGRLSTSVNTTYMCRHLKDTGIERWELYKIVSGTATALGSPVSQTLTTGNSYAVKLKMVGSTIEVYKENESTPIITVTDTAISDAGKAGIRMSVPGGVDASTGAYLDNFSADDAGGPTTYYQTNTGSFPAPAASLANAVTFMQTASGNMPYATGTVIKQINKNIVGDVPYSTGSVTKQTNKNLSGDLLAPTGSLGTVFIAKQALTGVLGAITGALSTVLNPVAPSIKKLFKLLGSAFKKMVGG